MLFKRYEAFIGELDERQSIGVYYEFVAGIRLHLYQDRDLARKIAVV